MFSPFAAVQPNTVRFSCQSLLTVGYFSGDLVPEKYRRLLHPALALEVQHLPVGAVAVATVPFCFL